MDPDSIPPDDPESLSGSTPAVVRLAFVLLLLFGFLLAIQTMGSAIKLMGKGASEGLFDGVANPFAGLSVGVLATVLVQSSSTTTSTIVSLVGSGSMKVATAVPMVMGANIGTTITNTLVSIGHVRQGPEFKRAFAAATVHDFFNLLCVVILLPLEMATGYLARLATATTRLLHGEVHGEELESPIKDAVKFCYDGLKGACTALGLEGTSLAVVLLLVGIALTFLCLIFITRNMRELISGRLEAAMNRSLGRSGLIGLAIGLVVTVAVQSSSITTSLLVPLCAAGVLTLENAFPMMLGANVGTTVTAILASLATERSEGLTIALVHLFFNLTGVLLFYPVPAMRRIPMACAQALAERAQRNPLWVVGYIGLVFIGLPLFGWGLFRGLGAS